MKNKFESKSPKALKNNNAPLNLKSRKRSYSDSFFQLNIQEIEYDSFFNNKRKRDYEIALAGLFLKDPTLLMPIIKKISALLLPDFCKIAREKELMTESLSTKAHQFFTADFNLNTLYPDQIHANFYEALCATLESDSPHDFYKHMSIQFSYAVFFTYGNEAKPELKQAIQEQWCAILDLKQLLNDMNQFRCEELLFKNYERLQRSYIKNKESDTMGMIPPDDYPYLSQEQHKLISEQFPRHQSGMLKFFMSTVCDFTREGMHFFDLPQLCGPSGTTAKRLALANQAHLNRDEKQLMQFVITLYNVKIGAHTIDECFVIAKDTDFNSYIRGDYTSIIPQVVREQEEFAAVWQDIQRLNKQYEDILIHPSLATSQLMQMK